MLSLKVLDGKKMTHLTSERDIRTISKQKSLMQPEFEKTGVAAEHNVHFPTTFDPQDLIVHHSVASSCQLGNLAERCQLLTR